MGYAVAESTVAEVSALDYVRKVTDEFHEYDMLQDIRNVDEVSYPELVIGGKSCLCFCSNNYLGLSIHPEVKRSAIKAVERYGIGTCESRLIAGNLTILEELERTIAEFKCAPDAIVYLSGYMTNIGVIPAIIDSIELPGFSSVKNEDNIIIKDALCHTSIIDGCKLSKSPKKTYLHNNMNHLETILRRNRNKRKLIITDGVFSMDGDMANLPDIVGLAREYNAIVMVDDAHATGVIGKNGRGTAEYFGLEGEIDIMMGTLSKAIGALGGFVTASSEIIEFLKTVSHSYIFSSSLPPEQACGIMTAINIIKTQPELRARLWRNVAHLKSGLQELGFDTLNAETHIIPILIGEERKSIQMSRLLLDRGILAPAVGWPAVKMGKSRIRCSVMAIHTPEHINQALSAFEEAGRIVGII